MTNDATYQHKIAHLRRWFPLLVDGIKKDLKQDHLQKDNIFCKQFFKSTNVAKLTITDLVRGYTEALKNSDIQEQVAEFMVNRWLLAHTDIYDFFEHALLEIAEDITSIKKMTLKDSRKIIKEASSQFGAAPTYIFSVLNEVKFPEKAFTELQNSAEKEQEQAKTLAEAELEERSRLKKVELVERELARQKDKYEKKLSGLQRLYVRDVACLKKQIAHLQRKLSEQTVEV